MKKKIKKEEEKHTKKYRHKKIGLPPETIFYTGERENQKINIESYSYNEFEINHKNLNSLDEIQLVSGNTNWINIDGVHNTDLVEEFGKIFNIDSFILEDMVNVQHRPKLEEREEYIFIIIKMLKLNPENGEIESEQFSMIIAENYLLTFQEISGDIFDILRKRINSGVKKLRKKGHDYLAYCILDTIIDNYFLVLNGMDEKIDDLEEKLINNPDKDDMERIMLLKREFLNLKRSIVPVRDMVMKMNYSREISVFKEDMGIYLNDLHDHILLINEIIESMNSRVTSLVEVYRSTLNIIMNETMKLLAVVSTIFVPLTFIAGIYGMNFEIMPELKWQFGYFGALGSMFIIGCGMIYYIRKRNWI
ncbi:MAG: magnesium/cobalt transporter CorA [Fusobacteriaceae bacterium]